MYGNNNSSQAREAVEDAKASVMKLVQNGADAQKVAAAAQRIAFWEGYAAMLAMVEDAAEEMDKHGISGMRKQFALMQEIAERLARGADDEWSGRDNDSRRNRFDGVRAAANEVIWAIQNDAEDALAEEVN